MSETAIAAWRELLGDAHVQRPVDVATFATPQHTLAVLQPGTRDEVRACVRIARQHGVPLHPISRGKNWGYGSRVPPRPAAVLDLARLDRIVDFDERLAYVTVEPGVTFRQLAAFLRSTRARVFASVTGGTADGSVIANALERGDGSGPLGDRFGHVCGLEVVLADGEVVHTGAGPTQRHAAGPALDGLFSQSGLGIVTRATIWLAPYPAKLVTAAWSADELLPVVEALRGLRLAGVTTATVPIWNDLKMLSLLRRYPFDRAPATPLPETLRVALRVEHGIACWNGTVSLYGASIAHAAALRDLVREALASVAAVQFRDGPDDPFSDDAGPALGVPHDHSAAAVYWRKRTAPRALDPDRDRCGFLWLSHALPFDGAHAAAVSDVVEREVTAGGFEPSLALLGVTERALSAVAAIAYDRDVDGEDARAMACHDRLYAALVARGYPPFRTGIHTPPIEREPRYAQLLDDLARALDPHGVFIARR